MCRWSWKFKSFKWIVDVGFSVLALPIIGLVCLCLLLLNPFFNPGPLFFRQARMGLHGKKFLLWKFRTMSFAPVTIRPHDAPVEGHRVTPLGRFLRRTRVDELPNFFNVLRGEMSVVGPRPDAWEHAVVHSTSVPYYADRFRVRPGITGLAQVRGGYADTRKAIRRKARYDRHYVRRSCGSLDLWILLATFGVLFTGFGAK